MAISPNDILEYLGVKCEKRLIIHEKNANALAKPWKKWCMVLPQISLRRNIWKRFQTSGGMSISECMGILAGAGAAGLWLFRHSDHYYGKRV
ncbi:MAG: hypothetical protein ACLUD2_15410 [Clostridium sp.]